MHSALAFNSLTMAVMNVTPASIAVIDREGRIVAVNHAWQASSSDAGFVGGTGQPETDYMEPLRQASAAGNTHAALALDALHQILTRRSRSVSIDYPAMAAGQPRIYRLLISTVGAEEGAVILHLDVTEPSRARQAVYEQDVLLASIRVNSPGAVFQCWPHADGSIVFSGVSANAAEVMGITAATLTANGARFADHLDKHDRVRWQHAVRHAATTGGIIDMEVKISDPASGYRWIRIMARPQANAAQTSVPPTITTATTAGMWEGIAVDVTDRGKAEERLAYLAYYDPLTDLPNRALFDDRLETALANAARLAHGVAVHYLDLDHFKDVNDTLGHLAGDDLLRSVATRLRQVLRGSDTIARLGGDEFAVIQQKVDTPHDAATLARKIVAALQPPFTLGDAEITVSTSVGIAISNLPTDTMAGDPLTPTELLKRADLALYKAKAAGRNTFGFYASELDAEVKQRMGLRQSLHKALLDNEFMLHYQPQVELATGAIKGVEALIRWIRPGIGLQPPGSFIPIAEETGLIIQIGSWVLHEACRQVKTWHDAGHPRIQVAVNVSGIQLARPDFVSTVRSALDSSGLPPSYLELELTESTLMRHSEEFMRLLSELRTLGVRLSIDDFGSGYSSFQYLKSFKIHQLKIDQSFVRDMVTDPSDAAIVNAIVSVARTLDLELIAEGVETAAQRQLLVGQGCAKGQGYHFSKPIGPEAFAELLASGLRLPIDEQGPKLVIGPKLVVGRKLVGGRSARGGR